MKAAIKSIVLFISMLVMSVNMSVAQSNVVWLGLGVRGGYGISEFFNSYAFFQDNSIQIDWLSPSYYYAGRFSFEFGQDNYSLLVFEFGQNYYSLLYSASSEQHEAKLRGLSYGLGYKFITSSGFYVELGGQLFKPKYFTYDDIDLISSARPMVSFANFGFGFVPFMSDFVEVSLGLRGFVALNSLFPDSETSLYVHSPNFSKYSSPDIVMSFMPVIDINFLIAYMGRASCGAFRIMLNRGSGTQRVRMRF